MTLGYTNKAADDYLGQTDTRDAARKETLLHQHQTREHNDQTGAHELIGCRMHGGTVSEAGGAYTLEDNFGLVASIAKIGTGQVRVTLSAAVAKSPGDAAAYWYPVDAFLHDALGSIRVEGRTSTTFDVILLDRSEVVQEAAFGFTLGGLPA